MAEAPMNPESMPGRVAGMAMKALKGAGSLALKGAKGYGKLAINHPLATGLTTAGGLAAAYGVYRSMDNSYQATDQTQMQQAMNQQVQGQGVDEPVDQSPQQIPQGKLQIPNQAQVQAQNKNLTYQDFQKEKFRLLKENDKIQDQLSFNQIYQNALS